MAWSYGRDVVVFTLDDGDEPYREPLVDLATATREVLLAAAGRLMPAYWFQHTPLAACPLEVVVHVTGARPTHAEKLDRVLLTGSATVADVLPRHNGVAWVRVNRAAAAASAQLPWPDNQLAPPTPWAGKVHGGGGGGGGGYGGSYGGGSHGGGGPRGGMAAPPRPRDDRYPSTIPAPVRGGIPSAWRHAAERMQRDSEPPSPPPYGDDSDEFCSQLRALYNGALCPIPGDDDRRDDGPRRGPHGKQSRRRRRYDEPRSPGFDEGPR